MMNGARIAVGVQGIAVASTAYLNALAYARERQQGSSIRNFKDPNAPRVPIIEHSDVRRMLLEMKAKVEGMRALAIKLALHADLARALAESDAGAGRLPPGAGRPAHADREGVRLRPGVPRRRDGHPDLRRRRLRRGPSGRAVPARREDLLDLRGHQPHPGPRPRRPQAAARAAARTSRTSSRRSATSSPSTLPGPGSAPSCGALGEARDGAAARRRRAHGVLHGRQARPGHAGAPTRSWRRWPRWPSPICCWRRPSWRKAACAARRTISRTRTSTSTRQGAGREVLRQLRAAADPGARERDHRRRPQPARHARRGVRVAR